jgi:hypothetical protein
MSSFQNRPDPTQVQPTNSLFTAARYFSPVNAQQFSALSARAQAQQQGGGGGGRALSLDEQIAQVTQECNDYKGKSEMQYDNCMGRLQELVGQKNQVAATPQNQNTNAPTADRRYDSVEDIRAGAGYGKSPTTPTPAAAPAAQPSGQPAAPAAAAASSTDADELDEIERLTAVLAVTEDPSARYVIGRRIEELVRGRRDRSTETERQSKLAKRKAYEDELKKKLARKPTPSTAPSAPGAMPYSERGPGDQPPMPYSERGPGDQTGAQPAPEMTRITPGMTGTQFGPMLGKFSPAQSTSRGAMDPYELALYEGTITPDEYRRLTGDGMEQPGVSDYENALNVMTGHAQYKGGRLPGAVNMPTMSGYTNVPGSPNFRLPASQMEPMPRPRQTEASPGPVPPGARAQGPSFGEREAARLQAEGLMPNPQQALEALNMAEARLSLGQIGPAEAGELQRIRQLKQRLVEDMARRQRGIF